MRSTWDSHDCKIKMRTNPHGFTGLKTLYSSSSLAYKGFELQNDVWFSIVDRAIFDIAT